ncbi:MAG: hypothetical protein SPJ12_03595 [Duodenibacillus sp.]|nr:hypothetical protein [Duodenibacillus sp.]
MRLPVLLCLCTLALAGCSSLTDSLNESVRERAKVQTIDQNLFVVEMTLPAHHTTLATREAAYEHARQWCEKKNQGAQYLEGVSKRLEDGRAQAKVVFRCVHFMRAPSED